MATPAAKIVNRATVAPTVAAPVTVSARSAPAVAQAAPAMSVSSPHDPAEKEAERTASRVMRMADPLAGAAPSATAWRSPQVARQAQRVMQRASASAQRLADGVPAVAASTAAEIAAGASGGAPLPASTRRFMEPRFGARFDNVRVHDGARAAALSRQLGARAFTVGHQIYFGRGHFQPDTPQGRELLAHELTHTIQQGAVAQDGARDAVAAGAVGAQRAVVASVGERAPAQVQRWDLSLPDPTDWIANKAAAIPGFTMLTVVLGYNPITRADVDRSAGNILRGAIQMIPGGEFITQALDNHGIFDKVSQWTRTQFDAVRDIGSTIWQDIKQFIGSLGADDLLSPAGAWERGKRLVTGPIEQIRNFAVGLKNGIVNLVRDAILRPIGAFARTTRGYPLLCAVMGKDPITGEAAPQDAEALMGAFMNFIGEQELWATMQKTNAVPRAFAWFKGAVAALKGFVNEIPGLFSTAFHALEIMDLILITRAFAKLADVFGGFAGRFVTWGANAVWNLLEIIFDVVKPGVMGYIKRTGAALKAILRNPMPFVGNLVQAAKLGFLNFAGNFVTHLKTGLIEWLTGALTGVYVPKALTLGEIVKFVFSVLGLTWANLRLKLVKAFGETAVGVLEKGFDLVKTLVTQGPAAAWEQLKDQLSSLKDTVVEGIKGLVIDAVVTKAIPKLIAMFIPGAGFVSAILSIYDTVMVFVNKIAKIIQVVTAFIDSIVAIAAGNIGAAAARVESILAGLLSLAINFLAGFAGLGSIAGKINGVIQKIRAPVDKALDALVGWIKRMAKKLLDAVTGANDTPEQKQKRLDEASAAALSAVSKYSGKVVGVVVLKPLLALVKLRYRLTSLEPIESGDTWAIRAEINPVKVVQTKMRRGKPTANVTIEYETHWPLDEFMSKANAIKDAAESKPVSTAMTLPIDTKTGKQKTTGSLRVGGQDRFRSEIQVCIDGITTKPMKGDATKVAAAKAIAKQAQKDARVMMTKLQADHQQELQMGGTDEADNMAMIEQRMNSQMGSMFRGQLKELDPESVLKKVTIDKSAAKPGKHRKTGEAAALRDLLLKHADKAKTDDTTIRLWFKLD